MSNYKGKRISHSMKSFAENKFEEILLEKCRSALSVKNDISHDMAHALRVMKLAKYISFFEGGNLKIILPAALFHDIICYPKDSLQTKNSTTESAILAEHILTQDNLLLPTEILEVKRIINNCSFSKKIPSTCIEEDIVRDADLLEASGAVSIMRTFASAGIMNHPFYNLTDPFARHREPNDKKYALDLFFTRLLQVRKHLKTITAKQILDEREAFLNSFLKQLEKEIEPENDLIEQIKEEEKNWSKIFEKEKNKPFKKFSSFWWKKYYSQMTKTLGKYIHPDDIILEAGSGSGKASFLLAPNNKKILLDISKNALNYAKFLEKQLNSNNTEYIIGNIFNMKIADESVNFCWNVGVVEHYSLEQVKLIVKEMLRVTKNGGYVAIGYPNFWSGPILKAWLLSFPLFSKFQGYRLSSEHFYQDKKLKKICKIVDAGHRIEWVKTIKIGNPLPMETPKLILKIIGPILNLLYYNRFLTFILIKINKKG